MKTLILSTIQKERLQECLNKKVYGLSEGMVRKLDRNIFEINFDDFLYLKLKKQIPIILGPFKIKNKPFQIKSIQSKGVWFKIEKNYTNKNLPWWIIEGFNWLIFFDFLDNKIMEIQESKLKESNLFVPDYGIIQTGKDEELFYSVKNKGVIFKDF